MTTHRYPPPPPLPPPPPPANRQYHVHYSSPAHSSPPNYYSSSQNYIISQDRRRSSFAREGRHSPIKEQKTTYESYPQQQRRRRSSSPQPTNSSSPQSSESHSPDMASQRPTDQKKTTQTAKRAAQNRAAQRAFRQRRERYVKDLEIRVKEMDAIQEEMNKLVEQNTSYRKQIDNLTREVKQLKEAGQSFTPYASGNKHVMTPKSPPPPPPPPVQQPSLSPTEPEHKQNAPRFTSAAKDANNQLKGSSFEAEMARRLNHSDHTMNQDSASYSESLYSLQQRRGMTSPRKPSSNSLSARTDDYQFPIPTANVEQKNINSFNHSNGHVHNRPLEGRKDVPATSQPNAPGAAQSKPMPNGNVFVSSGASPMMDHPYPLPPRSDVGILPTPVYSNEPRFIHQFGDIDHTNPGLVGMIDMPPLSMGEGEFEMEDPFAAEDGADDLDFAPEDCDRILDDLVTILQQRNRPQIPHNLNPNEA